MYTLVIILFLLPVFTRSIAGHFVQSTYSVEDMKIEKLDNIVDNSYLVQDPVCGSAHCGLASYWSKKLGKCDLKAYQV